MIDIDLVVETLDAQGLIRKGKISGDWYQIHCPFHNDGNERRPSCGVSRFDQVRNKTVYQAGMFHCFACSTTYPLEKAVSEILKIKGISQTGQSWLKSHVPGYEGNAVSEDSLVSNEILQALNAKYAANYVASVTLNKSIQPVSEEELQKYRFTVPYMYERKLTDKIIEQYDIGYDANWIPPGRKKPVPCITFPVRDKDKRTLFFCRRSIQGKLFNYPEGVEKPVYGIEMIPQGTKTVVICESCFNALTAVSYGYPAVALLGTGNDYQIQQLKELGVPEYVLCFDGDEAGKRGTARMKKALKSVAIVWEMHVPEGKDANDMTKEEFDSCYEERD